MGEKYITSQITQIVNAVTFFERTLKNPANIHNPVFEALVFLR
jgi:hypothetical protein